MKLSNNIFIAVIDLSRRNSEHTFKTYDFLRFSDNIGLIKVPSSSINTGSIRDDPYWTSGKNSLELIELSSINKVSLV